MSIFAMQELFKGQTAALIGADSDTGGWEFNLTDADYWRYEDPVNNNKVPIYSYFANKILPDQLKSRPFFSKNPDREWLYSPNAVSIPGLMMEEMLANEIPALTNAAGHRGVKEIRTKYKDRDIDIRQMFAVGTPWPRGTDDYEWKHSDIYVVSYLYLSGLYDEWVKKIQGVAP